MKVTVELSDQEMTEILELTGERKKGPAIRRLMEEALQQRRRAQIAQRCLAHKPYAQRLRPVRPSWQRSTKTEPVLQRGLPAQQLVIAPRRIQGSSPSIRPPSARCTAPSSSCPGHCCKPSPRGFRIRFTIPEEATTIADRILQKRNHDWIEAFLAQH
jgi:hypothetical protein